MDKDKLKRFFDIAKKIQNGLEPPTEDLKFFMETVPDIDEAKIQEYVDAGEGATKEQLQAALIESGRKLQSDPIYKEKLLKIATDAKGQKTANRILEGVNLVLAGTDIANSINQIHQANQASKKSRRPSRPIVPQRDLLLQQALQQAGNFDSERAIAPVRAEIQDQYLNDIRGAETASTGQAGAYGTYRQLAANRRNRAALNLAPIQDSIEARNQNRYDNLLGMRLDETQNMFQNQASLYPYDLQQYGLDQQAAAQLGSQGRSNLRNSLYNIGGQFSQFYGNSQARRNFNRLKSQMSVHGEDVADMAAKGESAIRKRYAPNGTEFYNDPERIYEAYNRYNSFD